MIDEELYRNLNEYVGSTARQCLIDILTANIQSCDRQLRTVSREDLQRIQGEIKGYENIINLLKKE